MRERDPLQVGERLARADPRERAPVVAGELPPQLVLEARLVGVERRQREAEDQVGDVVGAVLREREQEQPERPPRVVVEPAEQAEVEQAEPPVGREQDVPAVRIGVVDAVHRDLLHVGAEELPGEHLRPLGLEAVLCRHLHALDPLLDEDALGHVRVDHIRHDEVLVLRDELRDQLGAVRLLDEVELGAEMGLELLCERLHLDEPGRLGVTLGEGGQ